MMALYRVLFWACYRAAISSAAVSGGRVTYQHACRGRGFRKNRHGGGDIVANISAFVACIPPSTYIAHMLYRLGKIANNVARHAASLFSRKNACCCYAITAVRCSAFGFILCSAYRFQLCYRRFLFKHARIFTRRKLASENTSSRKYQLKLRRQQTSYQHHQRQ
jgi:hypothetical protein